MKILVLVAALFAAQLSSADQCALNDKAIAARGAAVVKALVGLTGEQASAYILCEPCGDTVPTRVYLNEDLSNSSGYAITYNLSDYKPNGKAQYWEVILNKDSRAFVKTDLAYLYLKTAADVYTNVANMVGCPVTNVSPFVRK